MSEKNLPPSHQRLEKAREEGQIGVSQDMVSFLKFSMLAEFAFSAEAAWRSSIQAWFDAAFFSVSKSPVFRLEAAWNIFEPFFFISLGIAFAAGGLSWAATLLQTGFNVAPDAMDKGWEKLDPAQNLQEMFSMQKLMMLVMGPIKIAAVMVTCLITVWGQIPLMTEVLRLPIELGWRIAMVCLHAIERASLGTLLVLSVLDFALQRWLTYRSLRMDIQEQKQEYKDDSGDPHLNQQRKSVHKEILNEAPENKAAKANAVVVNPQHIAIALSYDFTATSIPKILSKCHEKDARKLREFAERSGIPVIKYVGLARKLYAVGKDGGYVPRESLREVALLYRLVQELAQERSHDEAREIYEIDDELAQQLLNSGANASN